MLERAVVTAIEASDSGGFRCSTLLPLEEIVDEIKKVIEVEIFSAPPTLTNEITREFYQQARAHGQSEKKFCWIVDLTKVDNLYDWFTMMYSFPELIRGNGPTLLITKKLSDETEKPICLISTSTKDCMGHHFKL